MNKDDILNSWRDWVKGARPQEVLTRLSKMWRQIEGAGPLKRFAWKIRLAWGLVRDTLSGEYEGLPKTDLLLIVGALAYLVLVVDIVPDFIPVLGWMDDCVVLAWVFARISDELDRYEAFLRKKGGVVEAECSENPVGTFGNLPRGE